MFGLSSGELFFIAIVALVVLGPQRLPKAARFIGLWVRRARAQWYSVKDELERELAAEELKRNLDAARASVRDMETQLREQGSEVQREFERVRDAVESGTGAAAEPPLPEVETSAAPVAPAALASAAAEAPPPAPDAPASEVPRPAAVEKPDARHD